MLEHLAESNQRPVRVLLIGRSGFLARHLATELAARSVPLEAIGRPELDLTSASAVDALASTFRPDDTIVILSALTPDKGRDFRTLMKNLRMAEHLAEALDRSACAHVIYVSSDAVYDGQQAPIDENSSRQPVDLYAAMHTTREMMLQSVLAARRTPFCVLRPVALFGAGDSHNSYGPNRFVREAFEHGTITLFGEGADERSHVFVNDAARLIGECVARRSSGTMNIANPDTVSFRHVAELVRAACPFPVRLVGKETTGTGAISRRPFSADCIRQAFPEFEFTSLASAVNALVDSCRHAATRAPTS